MIIKSLSRKPPTFGQLISYMDKDGNQWSLTHNCYADGMDFRAIEKEFMENHRLLPRRSNGNALYHEIITLEQKIPLPEKEQVKILEDLANRYITKRAPNCLVYGRIHNDQPHLHLHLLISSNEIKSEKRMRLSKGEFGRIQKELEAYKIKEYPGLGNRVIYGKDKKRHRTPDREYAYTKRTGKLSLKQEARLKIETAFAQSHSFEELETVLGKDQFSLYQRGSNWGVAVLDSKLRFRLKTLGLDEEFKLILYQYETLENRQKELLELRANKSRGLFRE